jgi:hypothetical protein
VNDVSLWALNLDLPYETVDTGEFLRQNSFKGHPCDFMISGWPREPVLSFLEPLTASEQGVRLAATVDIEKRA